MQLYSPKRLYFLSLPLAVLMLLTLVAPAWAAPGDLDPAFDGDGQVVTPFGVSPGGIWDVTLQSDGKIVAVGYIDNGNYDTFALARYNLDGSLDTTFDGDGLVDTDFGGESEAEAVAIQPDGKIVVAGWATVGGGGDSFALARYNSDGSLDTTFDGDGLVLTNFPGDESWAKGVVIQSDGKIVAVGSAGRGSEDFALARYDDDGSLDTSFGTDGLVTTDFDGNLDMGAGVALQPDGKIVMVGYIWNEGMGTQVFALARYNGDGGLDTTFDGDGLVTTDFGFVPITINVAYDVALQSDGKIVVAGMVFVDFVGQFDFALARYNSDGSLDTSFDGDGLVTTNLGNPGDMAQNVIIQSDGKIVAVGYTTDNNCYDFALARYNSDGSLDTSFDGDGLVISDFGSRSEHGWGAAIQPDGKIIAAGDVWGTFGLARYNSDGGLDTSFDSDGLVITDLGSSNSSVHDIVLQSDGKVIVAGYANNGNYDNFGLARYNSDGSLDTSFDGDGLVLTDFDNEAWAYGLAIQSDGKIVAAGYVLDTNWNRDFALARYNPDGSLDTTFDADGLVITDFDDDSSYAYGVALQSDGKIVAAGCIYTDGSYDFALARYNSDGSLDTTFDGDGLVTTDLGNSDHIRGVAIQSDGKIVVTGYTGSGSSDDFALARYNPDGSLDTTFDTDGLVSTDLGGSDKAWDVALEPDGQIIAAGYTDAGGSDNFGLARYNPDGSLDTTFDGDGLVSTDLGDSDGAKGVALQPDGKIVAAGSTGADDDNNFGLARYNPDGSLDISFGAGGLVSTDFGSQNDFAQGLAIQPGGKIVAAGAARGTFALARYEGVSSLTLTKTADPEVIQPGNPLTYTLSFGANVTATNVIITDVLPVPLTSYSYTCTGALITPTGGLDYAWLVEDLAPTKGGLITITGIVSPGLPAGYVFTNTAILTSSAGGCQTEAVVTVLNVTPVAEDDLEATDEDTPLTTGDVLANDSDPNGDTLFVESYDDSGLLGGLSYNGDGTFDYDPDGQFDYMSVGEQADDTFTYVVSDGALTDTATVSVTISGVNDAPVADDDTFSVVENSLSNPLDVLEGDTDVEGDSLTISELGAPNQGGSLVNGGVVVTYTPAVDFSGTEIFTYTVTDSQGGFDSATVTVTVIPTNEVDLAMSKEVDDPAPDEGDTIVYTLQLSNSGPAEATGVQVSDLLPNGVTYISDDGGGAFDPGAGAWNVGDIDAEASASLHISATVDAGTTGAAITNTATITASDQNDPNPGNDQDEAVITVSGSGCTELSGVILTYTNTGTIYTDTLVYFVANLSPDEADPDYHYIVTIDGQAGEALSASQEPLSFEHTFDISGNHTVEIAVWNCDMTLPNVVTASLDVDVYASGTCVDLESITILGEETGYVGVEYTFDTEHTPSGASLPISYTWDNSDEGASSIRTFALTGTYTLVVTATNCSSAEVMDSHVITISQPLTCTQVSSVALSLLTTGDIDTNTPAQFSLNVAPDDFYPPYTYTLDYGDGTSPVTASSSADPLTLEHTFATAGNRVVQIEVWNCEMSVPVTDTLPVTIVEPTSYDIYLPIVIRNG